MGMDSEGGGEMIDQRSSTEVDLSCTSPVYALEHISELQMLSTCLSSCMKELHAI